MWKYIRRRLIQLIPIVLGITFVSFALMHSVSGDAVDALYNNIGASVSEEIMAQRRADLGLDQPFLVQYVNWLTGLLTGDMGTSYISGEPVFDLFVSKLPSTMVLAISAIVITVLVSIPLGIVSAVYRNKFVDYVIRGLSFIGNSFPGFFVSLLLIYVFSVRLSWLPVVGNEGIKGLILPSATLSISMTAKYTRQVRAVVLEELNQNYVIASRARGIKERVILLGSVLKSSMPPIITLLSLSIGSLLGGTAVIESIFMWDGVGKLAVDSIKMRDYPMIQAYVVWLAIIYVLVNLVADIINCRLDPRVRLEQEDL